MENSNYSGSSRFSGALSRLTDYFLFYILLNFLCSFLPYFWDFKFYLMLVVATPLLWAPLEALFLSLFGSTPGRALFKIKLTNQEGGKLSFFEALKRALFIRPRSGTVTRQPLSFKRKILAAAVLIGCVCGAVFNKPITYYSLGLSKKISTEGWVQYASEDKGFTVEFPKDPEQESKLLPVPEVNRVLQVEELKSENEDVCYSVAYMELPRKWSWAGASTLLKGALDLMIRYSPEKTEILEKQFTMHQGHRALDFRLMKGDREVKGRLILKKYMIYKLTAEYPIAMKEEMAESAFIDSFDLDPKAQPVPAVPAEAVN